MTVTVNLKPQVDLPVWEWCKFAPTSTTAISSMTASNVQGTRYLYYQVSGELYRYDTITDAWNRMSNMTGFTNPTIMNNNKYAPQEGHYGRAISSGGGNNTIQLAGLHGQTLVGYSIAIIAGTGAGQERTITAVAPAVVHERGSVVTAGQSSIVDSNTGIGLKQWKVNQWRDYQFRCDFGTGRTQLRPILYNSSNGLYWSDANYVTINPWSNPLTNISVAAYSSYFIESHVVTVNSNWTTNPDSTSQFVIKSGGIWNVTQGTTSAPYFSLSYYDVLADQWYGKTTISGLRTAIYTAGSDLSMEQMTEKGGAVVAATAVASATARSVTTAAVMVEQQYANYELRIVSGPGIGQARTILSNTTSKFNFARDWDVTPTSSSTYEVWRDIGKIYLAGGGYSDLLQYSVMRDTWTPGRQFDDGQCNQLAATRTGQEPIALTSITRTATSITGITTTPIAGGTGYNIDDILTIGTGTGGTARVTAITTAGAVSTVVLETVGTGYTVATQATTVSPAGGTGCTIAVTAVDFSELAVTVINHNLLLGDTVVMSGANGTGAAKFNGSYVVIGVPNLTSFSYCSVGDPGAATATIANSPSANQVVDSTKNWIVNEHVGKLVQLSTNALLSTGQTRRIVSNTATTLVWTLAATAPVNGTSRYVIHDVKPFGAEVSNLGRRTGGTTGFATSGSTTTIVDTTKNWQTNCWSRTVNRKVRIVEGTGAGAEIAITSNTSNTLTFAAQAFTVDTTTRYIIMDTFGTATAGSTTVLTDSNQNWDVNCWYGRRIRFLSGTSQGNEYTITANTATTITYALGTAPDTSTAYAILEATPKYYGCQLTNVIASTDTKFNHKYLYSFVGSGTVELERYDITTEHWEKMSYFPQFEVNSTGTMYAYDGVDRIYINSSVTLGLNGRLYYYHIPSNTIVNASTIPYGHSTVVSGNRMEIVTTTDGLKYLYVMRHSGQEMWRTLLWF